MKLVIKFLFKILFKTPLNFFIIIVLPLLMTILVTLGWNLFGIIEPSVMLPNITCVGIVLIAAFLLPNVMIQYRLTQITQRIQVSKKEILNFYLLNLLCFAILMIVSYFFCFGVATLLMMNVRSISQLWVNADWYGVIYSLMLTIVMSLTFGFGIGYLCNTVLASQIVGIFLFVFSLFFGFMMVSAQMIVTTNTKIPNPFIILSYIWPYRYTSILLNESFLTSSDFNYLQSSIFDLHFSYWSSCWKMGASVERYWMIVAAVPDKYLDLLMPWGYMILVGGSIFWFKKTKFSSGHIN